MKDYSAGIKIWGAKLEPLTKENKQSERPEQRELRSLHFYRGDYRYAVAARRPRAAPPPRGRGACGPQAARQGGGWGLPGPLGTRASERTAGA